MFCGLSFLFVEFELQAREWIERLWTIEEQPRWCCSGWSFYAF